MKENETHRLQGLNVKLNFATDCWTSPNHRAFMAIVVFYIDENQELQAMLLDLIEVAESHTGLKLAQVFEKMLWDFGVEKKVSIAASQSM